MLLNESDKVGRCIARQGGFGEVRIRGDEIFWCAVNIGEVTAAATRDQDLLPETVCVLKNRNSASTFSGLDRAHQAGRASSENQCVKFLDHDRSHVKETQARQVVLFEKALF